VLLLLLILALNNVKRLILGNLGQLVGRVDVNRTAKSTRRKVLPLGFRLRLVTINCRCIAEDNNEVEQLLEKKIEKSFLGLVCLRRNDEQLAYEIKKKNVEFTVLECNIDYKLTVMYLVKKYSFRGKSQVLEIKMRKWPKFTEKKKLNTNFKIK